MYFMDEHYFILSLKKMLKLSCNNIKFNPKEIKAVRKTYNQVKLTSIISPLTLFGSSGTKNL
jgi:hypothetical protein